MRPRETERETERDREMTETFTGMCVHTQKEDNQIWKSILFFVNSESGCKGYLFNNLLFFYKSEMILM